MGEIIMRNWDFREFLVRVNSPSPIQQVRVAIGHVMTPLRGLRTPIWPVIPLISHICSYHPHRTHPHPSSHSFPSTTQPSSQNTKFCHHCLYPPAMIMNWHRIQHTPTSSIHWVPAYTEYSVHWVQHTAEIVRLPFILMITSWLRNVASASMVPPYTIDRHKPPLHESSKVPSPCRIPMVASWLTDA